GWLNSPTVERLPLLEQTAALIGARHNRAEIADFFSLLAETRPASPHLALLAGLADGLQKADQSLHKSAPEGALAPLAEFAVRTALSETAQTAGRVLAIRVLARAREAERGQILLGLMEPKEPAELRR